MNSNIGPGDFSDLEEHFDLASINGEEHLAYVESNSTIFVKNLRSGASAVRVANSMNDAAIVSLHMAAVNNIPSIVYTDSVGTIRIYVRSATTGNYGLVLATGVPEADLTSDPHPMCSFVAESSMISYWKSGGGVLAGSTRGAMTASPRNVGEAFGIQGAGVTDLACRSIRDRGSNQGTLVVYDTSNSIELLVSPQLLPEERGSYFHHSIALPLVDDTSIGRPYHLSITQTSAGLIVISYYSRTRFFLSLAAGELATFSSSTAWAHRALPEASGPGASLASVENTLVLSYFSGSNVHLAQGEATGDDPLDIHSFVFQTTVVDSRQATPVAPFTALSLAQHTGEGGPWTAFVAFNRPEAREIAVASRTFEVPLNIVAPTSQSFTSSTSSSIPSSTDSSSSVLSSSSFSWMTSSSVISSSFASMITEGGEGEFPTTLVLAIVTGVLFGVLFLVGINFCLSKRNRKRSRDRALTTSLSSSNEQQSGKPRSRPRSRARSNRSSVSLTSISSGTTSTAEFGRNLPGEAYSPANYNTHNSYGPAPIAQYQSSPYQGYTDIGRMNQSDQTYVNTGNSQDLERANGTYGQLEIKQQTYQAGSEYNTTVSSAPYNSFQAPDSAPYTLA